MQRYYTCAGHLLPALKAARHSIENECAANFNQIRLQPATHAGT
jgi:hypothetical protein